MNKAELVDALAEHFGGNKAEANRALDAVLQTIVYKTATEGRVTILGFGTFEKTLRPARTVQDPGSGKKIRVKALATPAFRAGAEFKAHVAGVKKVPRGRRKPANPLIAAPQERATSAATMKSTAKAAPQPVRRAPPSPPAVAHRLQHAGWTIARASPDPRPEAGIGSRSHRTHVLTGSCLITIRTRSGCCSGGWSVRPASSPSSRLHGRSGPAHPRRSQQPRGAPRPGRCRGPRSLVGQPRPAHRPARSRTAHSQCPSTGTRRPQLLDPDRPAPRTCPSPSPRIAQPQWTPTRQASWSAWRPLEAAVHEAQRSPGVYQARVGAAGPLVHVGMAAERVDRVFAPA
jgi:nucleoid DNA-binding protein